MTLREGRIRDDGWYYTHDTQSRYGVTLLLGFNGNDIPLIAAPSIMNPRREVRIVSLRSEIIINDYSCYLDTLFNHVRPRDTRQIVTRGALTASPIRPWIVFVNHTAGDSLLLYQGRMYLERKTISCLVVSERSQSGITPSKLTQLRLRILYYHNTSSTLSCTHDGWRCVYYKLLQLRTRLSGDRIQRGPNDGHRNELPQQ